MSLMVLVAGPYRSGTGDDPVLIERNMHAMEEAALAVFRAGHLPVAGEWFALPLIRLAGSTRMGDTAWDAIFHPVAERIAARCDVCLRIGGASAGADATVAIFTSGAGRCSSGSRTCRSPRLAGRADDFRRAIEAHFTA